MPQIPATEVTSEGSQQQLEAQESMQANVLDKIKGGDVFKDVVKDLPNEGQETEPHPGRKAPDSQGEEQTQEEQQEESQDDEEVVPKSKIQPRFDRLESEIKMLRQRLVEKEAEKPVDDTQRQLDSMNEDQLEDTLTQVRLAKEKARDDDNKLLELVKLERRVEKSIAQAPQKFVSNQVTQFNKAAERLTIDGDITNDNSQRVLEIAKDIYGKYPKLQSQVDGQAMALELAVSHYKELSRASNGKVETQNLKGQINTLKKKTTLDTKNIKGGGTQVNLEKLRNNAMNGTMRDKEKFAHNDPRFKFDAMIPDYLKG